MQTWTKKTIKRFWQATWKYKVAVSFSLSGVIAAGVINVIIPLYFKDLFNLLNTTGDRSVVVPSLISILVIIAVLEFVQWVCWRVGTFTASYFQPKVMYDLDNTNFAYMHRHSFGFFSDNFVGSLTKKVKWFSRAYEVISDRILWSLLPLIVNILIIVIVLFQRSWWLGVGIVVWFAIFFIVNSIFIKYKLKYDVQRSMAETETTGILADTFTNQSTVKLFNGFKREVGLFGASAEKVRRLRKKTWDMGNVVEAVQGFLMIGLEIGIFYVAILMWRRGILTLGDFVLIQAYIVNIFIRIWDFGKNIRQIYESLADAQEMTEVLDTPHEIADRPLAKDLRVAEGTISFQDVDFYYQQTRQILKKFSLTIAPHEHIALVGPSGAGKSTIIKVILRMHDVAKGHVSIDGQDIAKVTQDSLHAAISLVPQDPILFHRSLLENIRYSRPAATDEEVMAAAKAAHCHEFIVNLSDGYQTFVGERGIKLSSGERQRVAIARAILSQSPILILDEATSSLDSESERMIQDALDQMMSGRTVIAIAHRLSTIKKMDRIIVIDGGHVIEEGSHDQLLGKDGMYSQLWKLQAGGFIR
ncbi:MAG: ABC transporter ATP-binding protein [Patescibacteria group bacterium]